jgi:hypothetical protein
MPRDSSLVHIRFSTNELDAIDLEVDCSNLKHRHRPHTRSSWIREAIAYILELNRKRREVKGPKKFLCQYCKKKVTDLDVSYKEDLLTGETVYCCRPCAKGRQPG